jgi:SAM-dependent methyltransferase
MKVISKIKLFSTICLLSFSGVRRGRLMFDGLKFFDELWINHQPGWMGQAEFWNRRAASYNQHNGDQDSWEYRRRLIERLVKKAEVGSGSQVLDIGCGPGKLALLLAEKAARVEALDIAPKMIEIAQANAAAKGRQNVRFQLLDWSQADLAELGWENKFQLVLASKTPAVNDLACLKKMIAASSGYCCVISQVDVRNSVIDQLKPLVNWDEGQARLSRSHLCAFNLLWLLGYYPEVKYYDRAWESDLGLEEAELMYTRYFDSHSPLSTAQKEALVNKLKSLSQDGLVREQAESKVAVMFWAV